MNINNKMGMDTSLKARKDAEEALQMLANGLAQARKVNEQNEKILKFLRDVYNGK